MSTTDPSSIEEKRRSQDATKVEEVGDDDAFRPRIKKYAEIGKFRVADEVYISSGRGLDGPYQVSSKPSAKTYILCSSNGAKIQGGRVFTEAELQAA